MTASKDESKGITPAERRAKMTAEIHAATGIDDAMIERLVYGFYDRVRADPLIGPVFEARIKDWEPHLQRMCAFWSSVALASGAYSGSPMEKHIRLPVDSAHFDRWLELFDQTAADLCPDVAARHFIERAHRIAESLEMGIATMNGKMLARGERYQREDGEASPG